MQKTLLSLSAAFFLVLVLALTLPAQPPTTSGGSGVALLNLDNTIALHGYDPVAYFTRGRAVKGSKRIQQRLGMATYYFSSRSSRYTFLENAPGYEPQFGGYCATSMAMGRLEDIDPHSFTIYNNKLYMFNNDEALARFLSNPGRMIQQASAHYFEMARRQRSRY